MSKEKIAHVYALQKAADFIKQAGILGLHRPERLLDFANGNLGGAGNISAKFEIAFGVEVTLYVRLDFESVTAAKKKIVVDVTIGAPSSQRTIPQQVAHNSLLSQVTDLGAIIQAHLDGYEISFLENPEKKEK